METKRKISVVLLLLAIVLVFFIYGTQLSYASKSPKIEEKKLEQKQWEMIQNKFADQDQFNQRMEQKVSNIETMVESLYETVSSQKQQKSSKNKTP